MPAKNRLGSLGLTARETEVLTWIAQGKTNYEIGVILSACRDDLQARRTHPVLTRRQKPYRGSRYRPYGIVRQKHEPSWCATRDRKIFYVAASLGFEPRQRDSESLVLPLHYEATSGKN